MAVVSSLRTAPSSARAPAAAARTTPERAPRLPGQGTGGAPAITSALAARISCRTCIPLLVPFQLYSPNPPALGEIVGTALADQFPAERAGARAAFERRVTAHYV